MAKVSNTGIIVSPRVIEKTIYAKRIPFTAAQVKEVINLEIETHLRKYPDLAFDDIDKPIHNADKSHTYIIRFKKAEQAVAADPQKTIS